MHSIESVVYNTLHPIITTIVILVYDRYSVYPMIKLSILNFEPPPPPPPPPPPSLACAFTDK